VLVGGMTVDDATAAVQAATSRRARRASQRLDSPHHFRTALDVSRRSEPLTTAADTIVR
jgi:hypothetical protein